MAIETIELGKVLITFKGAWVGGGTYEKLDVVTKNDSSYICILDAPSGTTLDNGTYWRPLSLGAYDFAVSAGYEGNMEQFATDLADVSTKISLNAIANNLITTEEGKVLDARQGKVLDEEKMNKDGSNSSILTLTFIGKNDAGEDVPLVISYNTADGTFDVPLPSGATGQLFQELFFHAKAIEAINEGDTIQYAGAQGRHTLIKKGVGSELTANPYLFLGIATTAANANAFCKVTWFGNVNNIATNGYPAGTIIYADVTNASAGKITNIIPVAPYPKIHIGAVTLASTGASANGTILVRPLFHNKMMNLDDVLNATPSVGDVLRFTANNRYEVFNLDAALMFKEDKTNTNLYNITLAIPLAAGQYYTSTTARAAVPVSIRKRGLELLYETASGVWYKERFIGSDVANWTAASNWEIVPLKSHIENNEEVIAAALVELKNKIDALQNIIKEMILGSVQIDNLDIVKNLNIYGSSNMILTGTAAPAVVPDFIGQFFIKTSATTACYQATGNSSVNDWKQIG